MAAATPTGHRIRIVDEQLDAVPWDADAGLVGITCMTALAPRAYEIAARFRARGVPVVLGGMHPTLCTGEALGHADAVVAGGAEGAWPRAVADAVAGRLGGVYRGAPEDGLAGLGAPRHDLIDRRRYAPVYPVEATRGCPNRCGFCAVSAFHGGAHSRRPVAEVAAELAAVADKYVLFMDDNLAADRGYARALFEALAPLGKRWMTQATLDVAEDPGFVAAAAESGCIGVFVGMETFSSGNLEAMEKGFNRIDRYRALVDAFHRNGIGVEAGIVLGFPEDGPETFARTLAALDAVGVDAVQFSIFTPLPGTPAHKRWAGRIFDWDWAHYDFHHTVFHPERMTAGQLQRGHDWITREFYRPWRIARRVGRHLARPRGWATLPFVAGVNLAYWARVRAWGIGRRGREGEAAGRDPAEAPTSRASDAHKRPARIPREQGA